MKKILGLLGIVALGFGAIQAQTEEDQDPKAKVILDKLSEKNKAYSTIKGDFTNKMVNDIKGIDRSKEGAFILKGDKYQITLGSNIVFFDGEESIRYNSDDNEYYYMDEDETSFNPSDMFNVHNKDFKYKLMGEETVASKNCHKIYLWPMVPGDKEYQRLEVYIDKVSNQIVQFVSVGRDQTKFIVLMKSLKYNESIPDSKFSFNEDDYPGSEEG